MAHRIMSVDDSTSIRQMLVFSLKQGDYEVTEASGAAEAIEKIQEISVDMLITDLDMPGMNGIELTRKVRELSQYQTLPILILTTESDQSIKDTAKAAGATGWITKPFTPSQLLAVVDKFFRRS